MNERAELLAKTFTAEELEAMRARTLAAAEAEQRGEVVGRRSNKLGSPSRTTCQPK